MYRSHTCSILSYLFYIGGRLRPDDLYAVLTKLIGVSAYWYPIGLALLLSPGTLDAIKSPNKEHRECMREMLNEWLTNSPDPSCDGLITALRDPVVGKESLARDLRAACCTQEPHQGKSEQI